MADCCGYPPVISQDSFTTRVEYDPDTGYLITYYVDKETGEEVGIPPTYHLYGEGFGLGPTELIVFPDEFGAVTSGDAFRAIRGQKTSG